MGPTIAACIPECQTCRDIIARWPFEGVNVARMASHGLEKVGVGLWMGTAWIPRAVSLELIE
jgi:hypothetical protein